jgi:hypothetical protein
LFEGISGDETRSAYHKWQKDSEGWFHFIWMWRWTPEVATSHQICYARTPDLLHWENAAGEKVILPFRPDNEKVIVDGTPSLGGMHNSRYNLYLTADDEPRIAYVKYDEEGFTQIYMALFRDGEWFSKKISDWDFRWKFHGGGADMSMGGRFNFLGVTEEGTLVIDWKTETGNSGYYLVDQETLEQVDEKAVIMLDYPESVNNEITGIPDMRVRLVMDRGKSPGKNITYLLKWEVQHGGFAMHAPEIIPEGPLSPLLLLEIKK